MMVTMPPVHALLLDFGGVIADGPDDLGWRPAMAEVVQEVLASAGAPAVPPESIVRSLDNEQRYPRDEFWRQEAPSQPAHGTFWGDVVAANWPSAARAAVTARGEFLSRRFMELKHASAWQLRTGMRELLAEAAARKVPVAVVSNTLHGGPQRGFLDRVGLGASFAAQLYSDEEGVRKPNPALAMRAVVALGAEPASCWFVGDTVTRDVLVARRAGLAAAVLMRSGRAEPAPDGPDAVPDAVVADPVELRALLADHW